MKSEQIGYSEDELQDKLKQQHKNTRHDAIDVVGRVSAKYSNLINDLPSSAFAEMIDEIYRDIHSLKQRTP